jgi:CPA1 family monovalent cation:H+ antiporter
MGVDEDGYEERSQAYQRLSRELLLAQRNALVRLRNEGTISDEALHRIERDLEETRLDS